MTASPASTVPHRGMITVSMAAMMAYVADFRVMLVLTLAAMPLLLLIKKSSRRTSAAGEVADAAH